MRGIKAEDPRRDGEKMTVIHLPTLATDRTITAADDSRSITILPKIEVIERWTREKAPAKFASAVRSSCTQFPVHHV